MGSVLPLLVLGFAPLPAAAAPQDCLWADRDAFPEARVESQSVVIDGKIYVIGGFVNAAGQATPRCDAYDPDTDTWERLADMPTTMTHHTAAADGNTIWVAGGFFGNQGGWVVNTVLRYDVTSDTWSTGPILPGRRAGGALVVLGRALHFFGGFSTRNDSAGEHYVLDLDDVAGGWDSTSYPPLPVGRGHLSGAVLGGMIYAIGGQLGHDVGPVDLDLVDAYDPIANVWLPVASLPTPRSHAEASTFVYAGRLFVAGGRNNQPGGAPALDLLTAYDPSTNQWSEAGSLPRPLIAPSAKPVGDDLYLGSGGDENNVPGTMHLVRPLGGAVGPVTRVNAGGGELVLADAWCGDAAFEGGLALVQAPPPPIAGTTEDALYQTERSGLPPAGTKEVRARPGSGQLPSRFGYHFLAGPGVYRVVLHFAELTWTSPGERVFDVRIEGRTVLADHDLVAAVGPLTAEVRTFDVQLTDGVLDLEFQASVDRPSLAGIELLRLPAGTIESFCGGSPNSTGGPARLGIVGSVSLAVDDLTLVADGLPPGQLAIIAVSDGQASLSLGSGLLCLDGFLFQTPALSTGAAGRLAYPVPTAGIPIGVPWNLQVVHLDTPPFQANTSNALTLRFTP